ncbi:MAG: inositol monophosphatase family protein [Candidatus Helarchaeota archaeon]
MSIIHQIDFESHFQALYTSLLQFFTQKSYSKSVKGENIKEHRVYAFDLEVNDLIVNYFKQHLSIPAKIISEEQDEIMVGNAEPEYLIVLDPVDGSVNVKRGLNIFAVGIAVLKGTNALAVDSVIAVMVGNFLTGELYTAVRGAGAFCNGAQIATSAEINPKNFCLSFELSHLQKCDLPQFLDIIPKIHQVRSLGSAISALSLVAKGALDAHIDVRNRLTIENILPPSLLISEAGGVISDEKGDKLDKAKDLKKGFNIIASGNEIIHQWILTNIY